MTSATHPIVADDDLLNKINALLSGYDLPTLLELGESNRFEGQITGLPEISERALPYYYILTFPFIKPSGEPGFFHMMAEAGSGKHAPTVVVLMINGHVMLTQQFRPTHGEYFNECPRGFGGPLTHRPAQFSDVPTEFDDALRIVLREVPQQMVDAVTKCHVWHLSDVPHNTGTTMGQTAYYLVHLTMPQEAMGSRKTRKGLRAADGIRLMTSSLVGARDTVKDAHSIVAICGNYREIVGHLRGARLPIVTRRTA